MIRIAAIVAIGGIATTGAVRAETLRVSVAPLRSGWEATRPVGKRGSGVICAPAGRIVWRDVMLNPAGAADRIGRGLRTGGVDVISMAEDDDEAPARYRISARLVDLRIDACTPHFGIVKLLGGRAMKGHGRLTIAWTLRDRIQRIDVRTREIATEFRFDRAGETLAEALLDGVADNAKGFGEILAEEGSPLPR